MFRRHSSRRPLFLAGAIGIAAIGLTACGHMPWHHGPHSGFVLRHLDRQMDRLDLNDAQKASYQTLRAEIEGDMKRMATDRKETAGKIKAELAATNPDMKKIAGLMKDGMKKHPESFERHMDRLTEFYGQLNADQQQKVRAKLIKHLERFED